ncbi:MAG TPA: type VI secretion system tube protein Hcp [Gaiellaceae bacterium]|nr:type VI secretion system tube protein Hcp [Gaiellaceae bacterium]
MKKKLLLGVALATLVLAAVATYSLAASSSDSQTLNACVSNDGSLRLVASPTACRKNEHAVSWNTTGPAGPAGPAGPQGVTGPAGPAGPQGSATSDPDALNGTLQITGQVQGSIGPIAVTGFSHEIVAPHDQSTGAGAGKVENMPIVITKVLDKTTPALLQAEVSGENLKTVELDISQNGSTVETITLTNASISDYQAHGMTESWSFDYEKIAWQFGTSSTSSDWSGTTD